MSDPHSSMSLTAVLVLTVVTLVLMGGWLGAIFFAARENGGGGARLAEKDPGHAGQPEADTRPEDVPAGRPARPAEDGGTGEPLVHAERAV
jgi:hypothetical protein